VCRPAWVSVKPQFFSNFSIFFLQSTCHLEILFQFFPIKPTMWGYAIFRHMHVWWRNNIVACPARWVHNPWGLLLPGGAPWSNGYFLCFQTHKKSLVGGIPTPLKNMSSSVGKDYEGLSQLFWKIKHVWNHQPNPVLVCCASKENQLIFLAGSLKVFVTRHSLPSMRQAARKEPHMSRVLESPWSREVELASPELSSLANLVACHCCHGLPFCRSAWAAGGWMWTA